MKMLDPMKYGLCRRCFAVLPPQLSGTPCPHCDGDPYLYRLGYTKEEITALKEFVKAVKKDQPPLSMKEAGS